MVSHSAHAAYGNTAALRAAGVTAATPGPSGPRFVRAENGAATGEAHESAAVVALMNTIADDLLDEVHVQAALRWSFGLHARVGITTVTERAAEHPDAGVRVRAYVMGTPELAADPARWFRRHLRGRPERLREGGRPRAAALAQAAPGLEHCGAVTADQYRRAARLGATISLFMDHVRRRGEVLADDLFGPDVAARWMAARSAVDAGHRAHAPLPPGRPGTRTRRTSHRRGGPARRHRRPRLAAAPGE